MNSYTKESDARFLNYWESKRQNKGKMYLQTLLIWGLLASTLTYLFIVRFSLENFIWTDYAITLIVWTLCTPFFTFIRIRTQEKHYKKLKESQH